MSADLAALISLRVMGCFEPSEGERGAGTPAAAPSHHASFPRGGLVRFVADDDEELLFLLDDGEEETRVARLGRAGTPASEVPPVCFCELLREERPRGDVDRPARERREAFVAGK